MANSGAAAEFVRAEEFEPRADNVAFHPRVDRGHLLRIVEALLFAAPAPLAPEAFKRALPEGSDVVALLEELQRLYKNRGVNVVQVAGNWVLRTADDLSFLLRRENVEQKRLSKAALETLAIVAYHQPVTRAEIEDIRGVAISKGTLDILMEIGWVKMRGRRRAPGRPVTYGTTEAFLHHFGLNDLVDLPGVLELKGAGLLETNLPPDFDVPQPRLGDELTEEEDPLDSYEEELEELQHDEAPADGDEPSGDPRD
jgi:segregation and condensation protein B